MVNFTFCVFYHNVFKKALFFPHKDSPPQDTMALTSDSKKRSQLKEVAGIPLQSATVDNWSQIQNFEAKPDDLLICTYPKAGDWGAGQ